MAKQSAQEIVAGYAALLGLPSGRPVAATAAVGAAPAGQKALIFAPHPDDECITGALPLRLKREAGLQIGVVPVTLGSRPERREERRQELGAACAVLGFAILEPAKQAFGDVRPETRDFQPVLWEGMVGKIAALLRQEQPAVIFAPHRLDNHATHIGAHHLVMDALAKMPPEFGAHVVFTEFWHPQQDPNRMVESAPEDVVCLLEALMCHAGEMARNPYHRALPAWMIDNVRRGAELMGGYGAAAPEMGFATLYRQGQWQAGRCRPGMEKKIIACGESVAALLEIPA